MRILIAFLLLLFGCSTVQAADVTVTWDAPTTYVDGSPIDAPLRFWVKENGAQVGTETATTWTGADRAPGNYCYEVLAVVQKNGIDYASAPSPATCTDIVQPEPDSPTNITITVTVSIN